MTFTHLHVHTWFSFGHGASSPEVLARAAAERGYRALAMTDTNGVYGAVEFQRACEAVGIRPILGAHLRTRHHEAIVLAEDAHGWAALCRAITAIHWDPDLALTAQLAVDRQGLTVLSRDIDLLQRLVQLSGPAGICAELVPGPERHRVLHAARQLGIPAVVTGAVAMAHAQDWQRQRLLDAIHRNGTLDDPSLRGPQGRSNPAPWTRNRIASPPVAARNDGRDAWLRPGPDLERHFPDVPEAFAAAGVIAERCQYRIPMGRTIAPRASDADDALQRLRALAYDGAMRRYGALAPVTRDRLEHELGIIGLKGFADYFLVVHDIVQHGPTHCGRGSVANSIVSYCLGITHVEPLASGLLFERFLNPARKDPPDIDLDFPWDERDRILAWVFRKWPRPRAAMVSNHNTLRLRGALREVAKVHGRPAAEIREVTRRVPYFHDGGGARELFATHPNFRGLKLPAVWQEFAAQAEALVGTPRHLSLHPGGVVIVPTALTDVVPIEPAAKRLDGAPDLTVPVIQFEKDGAEDAGLVKIDLLGNRSLAVIRDAITMVREHSGVALDYTSQEAGADEATREVFRTGNSLGVFYTESPASRLLNLKSRADTFELLVLNTSIIRPASNRWITIYLERLHGAPYEPLHPSLRDTLAETFGVMVYQEDVVNVAHAFAGLDWASADGLRKALSKKKPEAHLHDSFDAFVRGAKALGRDEASIAKVWEMILSFAGYSFCKGHSCSYIHVAQQSAYLRANHPAEFIAAVLANGGGFYRPFAYVAEAMRMGVRVLPPDVNASAWRCLGRDGTLRVGFQFISGLSAEGVERLLAARESGGPFRDLDDLRRRAGLAADDLRLLVKVGACDAIAGSRNRPQLLWAIDTGEGPTAPSLRGPQGRSNPAPCTRNRIASPPVAARNDGLPLGGSRPPPALRDYPPERKRQDAWALLGFCTDCHPMALHAEALRRFRLVKSPDLARHVGRRVLMAGMYTTGKPVHTAKHEPMQFATFDDGEGLVECVLFPDVYAERSHVLFDQGPFIFRGIVEESFGALTVTVTHLERVERMIARMATQGPRGTRSEKREARGARRKERHPE
ncbi:MAG: DNA polymerase III subunit alpha [Gemmatimonadetes bacterium]|nr:DNA polymerase III subunit alpha [Gemmatimonadota bacterium]MCA9762852.1 DNA polymerase III subunit alpha [Gemmatimonadota bacterium]MCB9505297.1 DNA polymerase III subunit alpha [Gemmatimonadales bacterium]MCB9518005.1 DNA polymerase III subunit alpha [Gemmatimonadales bacterium]HPF61024.1 DNA polymerase III subunit alpha [Gemmatimonadales bacterium]